jgi:2-oxoisovalerate dehydrogenase E2 component (dihydrolipoyl transacylase)
LREFKLPDPGEGLTEADIVTWRVAVGDIVKVNDIVVEIETAKSLVELPIPYAGTVAALLVDEGATVEVGTPIIVIDDGSGGAASPGGEVVGAAAGVAAGGTVGDAAGGAAEGAASAVSGADSAPVERAASAVPAAPAKPERTPVLVGYGVKQTEAKRRPRRKAQLLQTIAHYPDEEPAVKELVHPDASSGVGELVAAHSTHVLRDQRPLTELAEHSARTADRVRALTKPPVRKLAKDLGLDLAVVRGSGEGGLITRDDVLAAAHGAAARGASSHGAAPGAGSSAELVGSGPAAGRTPEAGSAAGAGSAEGAGSAYGQRGEERIPIKGVRKVTAAAMVASAFTAPHVTEWVDVDVTATMDLVERLRRDREFRDAKVTPLLVLAKAMCVAVRRNPGINATWDEAAQEIVLKRYVNLGIAAATPRGLLVPNIKDADRLTMRELADAITALTTTAREGRTPPADMTGGTLTITNIGVFGIDSGTPILNPGEAAILAFGTIARKPWVVGSGAEERIEPRWVTTLALSFDHRLVDGELGSRYLADVAALLADPARGLVWG